MYEVIIGIDPGIGGAVAVLDLRNGQKIARVFSVPTQNIVKKGKKKKDYDAAAMAKILAEYRGTRCLVVQEATHAMPKQGTASMYSFGRGAGLWEGIVAALEMKQEFVLPVVWKKEWASTLLSIEKRLAKDKARELAKSLYSELEPEFARKKDDGKAEALLIAEYAGRHYNNEQSY